MRSRGGRRNGDGSARGSRSRSSLSRRRALRRKRAGCSRRRRRARTPSRRSCVHPVGVGARSVVVRLTPPRDALAGAALDPAELLDVDMHELTRPRALVADRLLEPDPAEPAHALPLQHAETVDSGIATSRRSRRPSSVVAATPQSPRPGQQACDSRPVAAPRSDRTSPLALTAIAAHPLASTAHADAGGLGRRRQRPTLNEHTLGQRRRPLQLRAALREASSGSSLGLGGLAALSLQGDPDEPTCLGTTPRQPSRSRPLVPAGAARARLRHAPLPPRRVDRFPTLRSPTSERTRMTQAPDRWEHL